MELGTASMDTVRTGTGWFSFVCSFLDAFFVLVLVVVEEEEEEEVAADLDLDRLTFLVMV